MHGLLILGTGPGAPTPLLAYTDADNLPPGASYLGLPILIGTYFLMRTIIRGLVARSGLHESAPGAATFPPLPDALRLVRVPGEQYAVQTACGLVFKKERTVTTSGSTTTTTGNVYSVGNQIYTQSGTTSSSVSTLITDVLWVRTADGMETTWTFYGDQLKVIEGQALSVIARAEGNGLRFLEVYNHATGQVVEQTGVLDALHTAPPRQAARLGRRVGTVGFAIAFWLLLSHEQLDSDERDFAHLAFRLTATLLFGYIAAFLISWHMTGKAARLTQQRRTEAFRRDYAPQYLSFFQQVTPSVLKKLGG